MTDKKKKTRVYISGKISGEDLKTAKAQFDNAKAMLTKCGYDAVSPFDNGLPDDAPYPDHMKADIRMLLGCDAILMLPGWGYSSGAWLENNVAIACGLSIYTLASMIEREARDER